MKKDDSKIYIINFFFCITQHSYSERFTIEIENCKNKWEKNLFVQSFKHSYKIYIAICIHQLCLNSIKSLLIKNMCLNSEYKMKLCLIIAGLE